MHAPVNLIIVNRVSIDKWCRRQAINTSLLCAAKPVLDYRLHENENGRVRLKYESDIGVKKYTDDFFLLSSIIAVVINPPSAATPFLVMRASSITACYNVINPQC